jgi:hypothetical protein
LSTSCGGGDVPAWSTTLDTTVRLPDYQET